MRRRKRAAEPGHVDVEPLGAVARIDADQVRVVGGLIGSILRRVDQAPGLSPMRRIEIARALWAARGSLELIMPDFCVRYLEGWRRDRETWHDWVRGLPRGLDVDKALQHLGA